MALLIEQFVSSTTYNNLPHIKDAAQVPADHANDLKYLRELLEKHEVPKSVSIRLIHKHFNTYEGEVMAFANIDVPGHGTAQVMKPVLASNNKSLRGLNYFFNAQGVLQAYEYGNYGVPDMAPHGEFLQEFCNVIAERNLQSKFGLKLKTEEEMDNMAWTEFEFHQKRSTIMLPEGMPMPDQESDYTVSTEWKSLIGHVWPSNCQHKTVCTHGNRTCKHCRHCNQHDNDDARAAEDADVGFCLGGQIVVPGTAIFDVVSAIAIKAF